MSEENIIADTLEEGKKQLIDIYKAKSEDFTEISKEEYEKYEESEHEDSDNHLQKARLGQNTKVIDQAYYKYISREETAYRINLFNEEGGVAAFYFKIKKK